MDPISSPALDETALQEALEAEAAYERIWLPPEPWWAALRADKSAVAASLQRSLARGHRWPRSEVVHVRKPGHGIRPVSLMSPEVRVLYRAIAAAIVPVADRVERTAEDYAAFVVEPIKAAYDHQGGLRRIGDSKYSHIVITDVAAFYQYIDHAILREELDLAGADIELVDALVDLLGDIEGRSYGLPQRSAPSDWLAEYYAQRISRWVVRDGFDVWRYSDDFRIGCRSYPEALRAIESLARAARDVGLVLNDQKTVAATFLGYLTHNANVEVHDASAEIDPSDVEAAVSGDYPPDDDDQAVAEATATIARVWDPGEPSDDGWVVDEFTDVEDRWSVRLLDSDQHRAVRRALNTLTRHRDPAAVGALLSLLTYQPAMTHRLVIYAVEVADMDPEGVTTFFERATTRLSLNEWQRVWMAYGVRSAAIAPTEAELGRWLVQQIVERPDSLAAAEAAVALASRGETTFDVVDGRLRTSSPDVAAWYLQAIAILAQAGLASADQVGALKSTSAIARAILR